MAEEYEEEEKPGAKATPPPLLLKKLLLLHRLEVTGGWKLRLLEAMLEVMLEATLLEMAGRK